MYIRAGSLSEALTALALGDARVLCGGTDFFPALVDKPAPDRVVDISRVDELRCVEVTATGARIGAGVTWSQIARASLPPSFRALQQAAGEVGSIQIQNVGTVAGNLCNASPAADGIPPLLCLDAEVEIASLRGARRLPLQEFVLGNRKTALDPDELMTAVVIPASGLKGVSSFSKLGARQYLVISIAMVAVRIVPSVGGTIAAARVAVGSCSAAARRLLALEQDLEGVLLDEAPAAVRPRHLGDLTPIDDVRGTADYRRDAALNLIRRTVRACRDEPCHA